MSKTSDAAQARRMARATAAARTGATLSVSSDAGDTTATAPADTENSASAAAMVRRRVARAAFASSTALTGSLVVAAATIAIAGSVGLSGGDAGGGDGGGDPPAPSTYTATIADFSRDRSTLDGNLVNMALEREPDYSAMPSPADPGAITITPATDFSALAWCSLENGGTQVRVSGAIPAETIVLDKDLVMQVQPTATGTLRLYDDKRGSTLTGMPEALKILEGAQIAIGGIRQILNNDARTCDKGTSIQRDGVAGDIQNVWITGAPADCLVWNHMPIERRLYNCHLEVGSTLPGTILIASEINFADVVTGDYVWADNSTAKAVFRALTDAPSPPPDTATANAEWALELDENPHQDVITIPSREVTANIEQMPRIERSLLSFQRATNTQIGVNNCIRLQDQGLAGNTFGPFAMKDCTLETSVNRAISGANGGAGIEVYAENCVFHLAHIDGQSLTNYARFKIVNGNDANQTIALSPTCEAFGGGVYIPHSILHDGTQRTRWTGSPWAAGRHGSVARIGTTDAPDGTAIEMRIVDESGAEFYPWAEIATASGGAWSGAYTGIAAEKVWLRPEVRPVGSTAPAAATANRFGIGLTLIEEDQSNTERGLLDSVDFLPQGAITIGNQVGDFQFTTTIPRGSGGIPGVPKTGASAMASVDDAQDYITAPSSLRAMAKAFHDAIPGLKVAVGFIVRNGTSAMELLQPSDDVYDWTEVVQNGVDGVVDRITADGSEIGIFHMQHTQGFASTDGREDAVEALTTAIFGTDNDGNVIVPDQTAEFTPAQLNRVDFGRSFARIFAHAMPGLLTGRTKWSKFFAGGALGAANTALEDLSYLYGPTLDTPYVTARSLPTKVRPNGIHQPHTGTDVDVHYSGGDLKGMTLNFASKSHSWLANAGLIKAVEPRFDRFEWAPDGSFFTVWSSAGDITTQARIEEGGAATNFPENPTDAPGTPGPTEVLGLTVMDPATDIHVNAIVEIVDAAGNPATAGRLKVSAPDGGTYPQVYYHRKGSVGFVTTAGLYRDWMDPDNAAGHPSRHFPIVADPTFPWNPYGGTIVLPPDDINAFAQSAIDAATGGTEGYSFALSDPAYQNLDDGFGSYSKATMQIAFNTATVTDSFQLLNTQRGTGPAIFRVLAADVLEVSVNGGAYVEVYNPATQGDPSLYLENVRLLIHYNSPNVEVYRDLNGDGTYTLRQSAVTAGGDVRTSTSMDLLNTGSGSILLSECRVWFGTLPTQDGTPPTRNVDFGIEMTAGGVATADDTAADGHALFTGYVIPT